MLHRHLYRTVLARLDQFPAVALLGSRQVGKTTLATQIAAGRDSIYLDLETPADRQKLADPVRFLSAHQDKLVILDEVQRLPELFQALRGLIDQGRRLGRRSGQFLLLGSASIELLKQSGESLAGRIAYLELAPLDVSEIVADEVDKLWIRGGYPESFLAPSGALSVTWRTNFIHTYLERDVPQFGYRIPAEKLRRFWTMLAHSQGNLLNAVRLAQAIAVESKAVARYLDLLVDLLLVRRLPPFHANVGKRLVKAPKVYVRDSGLVHALLTLDDRDAVLGHPVAGGSWEGFVIENLLRVAPERTEASFYRTGAGAEIDLLLKLPGNKLWAVEVKSGLAPTVERGLHIAREDLKPTRTFVVYAGTDRFSMGNGIEAIGLRDLCADLLSLARN